tara:strand:- start:1616 stop:2170 length:555 start_codon:yes stop_codon:yes gene_type:complete
MIKRCNDDIKADRPTIDEVKFIPKIPVSFFLENIRSAYNVGSIFRTADGMGAEKIFLSGYTCKPPRKDLAKTALGAELAVEWEHNENQIALAKRIKKNNIKLILLEHTERSKSIYEFDWSFPSCVVLGNEVSGVSEELIELCDVHLEIPMRGIKQSLNVAVAAGIIGYEVLRYYYMHKELKDKK